MNAELLSVSTRAELERYLEDVKLRQLASTARLAQLSAEVQAQRRLQELDLARSKLQACLPGSSAASVLLGSAADVGKGVRDRIQDVLFVYERARDAREMADQVLSLRSSIQGIYGAMDVRDWERAARLASKAREVPYEVANSDFAAKTVPTAELPDPPLKSLNAACDDLANLFTREFNNATQARQMDQVTRYFKLFPLVGHSEVGLKLYAQFICQIVAGMSRQLLSSAEKSTKKSPGFYAAVLSRLFEGIASIIEQHTRVVSKHYSTTAMPQLVMPLVQPEIDKQAGLILDTFWDERRIEMLLTSCKSYDYPYLVTSFSAMPQQNGALELADTEDLQEASSSLSEIGTMMNRWNLYRKFVFQKWPITPESELSKCIEQSKISSKISDLLGPTYTTLALFVFRCSVERAIRLDELPSKRAINDKPVFSMEAPLVSSTVDDIMYIFSTLLSQTIDCGHEPTLLSSIAAFKRVFESDLIGTLQRKLLSSAPVDSVPLAGEFGGVGPFMIYLNNLEVCAQYVGETISKSGPVAPPIADTLAKFHDSFKNKATELLLDGCQTFASIRVSGQVKQIVSSSFKINAYTTQVEAGRCGPTFRDQWQQFIRPLRQLLHPLVLTNILSMVLPTLSQQLERFVWSLNGKITEAGCLALDKDVSLVIAVSSEVQYSLRHKFVKLAQMVNALIDRDLPTEDLSALANDERLRILTFKVQS